MVKDVQIYPAIVHYFAIFFSKNDREIELVVLHTINPLKSKMGDNFFMDFSFFTQRFFEENLQHFFSQMPDAFGVCGTMCKVKKEENLFWGDSQLPSQNARTKVRLLYNKHN